VATPSAIHRTKPHAHECVDDHCKINRAGLGGCAGAPSAEKLRVWMHRDDCGYFIAASYLSAT
jgi:hypothetical protein